MGSWGGRYYADVIADVGEVFTASGALKVAHRTARIIRRSSAACAAGWRIPTAMSSDRLIVMHGISSRVLRGVMTGIAADLTIGAPFALGLPQGSIVCIEGGVERVVHRGTGHAPA